MHFRCDYGKGDVFLKELQERPTAAVTETQSKAPKIDVGYQPKRLKKKQRNPLYVVIAVLAILLLCAVIGIVRLVGMRHNSMQEDANIQYIGDIPVIQDYLPVEDAARTGIERDIRYIVIHETDNTRAGADAAAHNTFIHENGKTEKLSWHYTVDDHEIYHHLPDNEAAYNAGDGMEEGSGNRNGIGIEMCVNEDGDFEKTLQNAQKLTASLLHEYHLTIQDVRKHQDFSGKICPSTLIQTNRWDAFVEQVEKYYDTPEEN